MEKRVTLNAREQRRLQVLNKVESGQVTASEAGELLGLSVRQIRRLLAAYRREGAAGLEHGNRGRVSPGRVPEAVAAEILRLAQMEYIDYNDQHFTEELEDPHKIKVSRSTVRRLRREAGLGSPRKRRAPRHRRRRERYPQAGMLLQVDGSPHDWLEGRGPELTLVAAIDDATSEVPFALFREQEDTAGYYLLLQHICQSHGRPLALYAAGDVIMNADLEVDGTLYADGALIVADTAITATTTLTAAHSGKTLYISPASQTTITLPALTAGVKLRFVIAGAFETNNVVIDSAEGDNIEGAMIVAGAVVDCDAEDQINFVADGENLGDYIELESNGTKWFIGDSGALTADKMTCTDPS